MRFVFIVEANRLFRSPITAEIVKLVNAGHEAEKTEATAKLTDLRNKLRAAQEATAAQQ